MSTNRLGNVGVAAVNNIKSNGEEFISQMESQRQAINSQLTLKASTHTDENAQALAAMAVEKARREQQVSDKKDEILGMISQILGTANSTSLDTVYGLGQEIVAADNSMDQLVANKTAEKSDDIADYDADLGVFSLDIAPAGPPAAEDIEQAEAAGNIG